MTTTAKTESAAFALTRMLMILIATFGEEHSRVQHAGRSQPPDPNCESCQVIRAAFDTVGLLESDLIAPEWRDTVEEGKQILGGTGGAA